MPSSRALLVALPLGVLLVSAPASAQQAAPGFATERLYTSAPGGGWVVMDDLDMRGELGGAVSASGGYAHDPLRVTDGVNHLAVVRDQAFFDFGLAVTYQRFRLYLNLESPLAARGESGTVGRSAFTAPGVGVGADPDTLSDSRIGFDARLLGEPGGAFRLGVGAQLYVPSGKASDYVSDGTYRAMGRVLVAGNLGVFAYAGQLGVHIRPHDDTVSPGSPEGSELLFGVAAGPRIPVGASGHTALVIGPEIYGQSAFKSFFDKSTTGVEGLVTGRVEGTGGDGPQMQVKLGVGGGIDPHFGAPESRVVLALTLLDHSVDSDGDGVSDGKDACPRAPGIRTDDMKTSGCPADRDGDGVPDTLDACPDTAGPSVSLPGASGCPQASTPAP